MGRVLRFLFGALLVLVAVALGLRYGEPAYLWHLGQPADVTVAGPCTTDRFLFTDRATRCRGSWKDGRTRHSGAVIAADRPAEGQTVAARVFAGDAFVRPTGASLVLGYAAIPLGLVGLYVALKRRRRRHRSSRGHGHHGHYYEYDGDDDGDDRDDSDGGDDGGDGGDGDGSD